MSTSFIKSFAYSVNFFAVGKRKKKHVYICKFAKSEENLDIRLTIV